MSAVGVWESRGPGAGMGGSDRPRDFQRTGAPASPDLQIQRDVDRASPGRALPQRPVGVRCTVRSCGDASATVGAEGSSAAQQARIRLRIQRQVSQQLRALRSRRRAVYLQVIIPSVCFQKNAGDDRESAPAIRTPTDSWAPGEPPPARSRKAYPGTLRRSATGTRKRGGAARRQVRRGPVTGRARAGNPPGPGLKLRPSTSPSIAGFRRTVIG